MNLILRWLRNSSLVSFICKYVFLSEYKFILIKIIFTGLIEEYVQLLSSALQLSPAIDILLGPQLQRFGLTWEVLNKHLYQSLVYTHFDIQENLPRFIGQVSFFCFYFEIFLKRSFFHLLFHSLAPNYVTIER